MLVVDDEQGSDKDTCFMQDVSVSVERKCVTRPLCGRRGEMVSPLPQLGTASLSSSDYHADYRSSDIFARRM